MTFHNVQKNYMLSNTLAGNCVLNDVCVCVWFVRMYMYVFVCTRASTSVDLRT